ncbi:unnamed protein product [Linum tenue]|uniref:Uncharacterized protein n=1 Tax=Linum tenue TaxID=586396 RepID=A0AAV0HS14_9ROSI|nr:unnamed protein product [Linum tenue]
MRRRHSFTILAPCSERYFYFLCSSDSSTDPTAHFLLIQPVFMDSDMDAADCFSAIWEEIDRSERRVYEEAASMSSAVLKRILDNGYGSRVFDHDDELSEVMESAGMVLMQSLNKLGRASSILSELKDLFVYPAAVPAEALLTGQLVPEQRSQDFASYTGRRNTLDAETFLAIVEVYTVTLLGKHLKELNIAISWLEKAALPEEKRQVLLSLEKIAHNVFRENLQRDPGFFSFARK